MSESVTQKEKVLDNNREPSNACTCFLQSLGGTDGYELKKTIRLTALKIDGGDWTVSFHDASIHASGENLQSAMNMLRKLIVSRFKQLNIYRDEDKLNDESKRQLKVLEHFIEKTDEESTNKGKFLEVLRKVEWIDFESPYNFGLEKHCPVCEQSEEAGHAWNCELGKLIEKHSK